MIKKSIEKDLVIKLRRKGASYSQIKNIVNVSKSTLSSWLSALPLSKKQISKLRDKNPQRIERFRNTMHLKSDKLNEQSYTKVTKDIGNISKREFIISGLYLYWGEGTKAAKGTVALTNTDPDMLKFFVKWLRMLNVNKRKLKAVLHLYRDMNVQKEMQFWSNYLRIPIIQFRKPVVKHSRFVDLTYKNGLGHGTCSVLYLDMNLYRYIMSALKYIRKHA